MSDQLSEPALDVDGRPPGFELRQMIGRSASSRVFEAHQQDTGRVVALTVLEVGRDGTDAVGRFARVCAALRELSAHPHIRTLVDAGRHGDRFWVAMELCPGGSLADRLVRSSGPVSVADAADVLAKIADALGSAHGSDVVHGDIAPVNIMTTGTGEPVLSDFGVARLRADRSGSADSRPTLHYAPPEVLSGGPATTAGDVYALGATIWHLLEGRSPFGRVGDSGVEETRIRSEPFPTLTRSDVPDSLRSLLATMTATDPRLRPTQLSNLADEAATIAARARNGHDGSGAVGRTRPPARPGPPDPQFEVVTVVESLSAPRTSGRRWWSAAPGSSLARVAAAVAVGLVLLAAVAFAVLHPGGAVDRSPQLPPGTEVSASAAATPSPPGPAPEIAAPAIPAEGVGPVVPTVQAPPGAPPPSAPPDRRADPGLQPAKRGAVTVTGMHVLTQRLPGECTTSRFWTIKGPISFTVAPDGAVSGSASGRGSGSTPANCGGISGTLHWNLEYTVRLTGQVRDGVLSATGTMIHTDRTTAAGCAKDGRPVNCPSNAEAGTNQYPVTVSGRFDRAGGAGLGAMTVEMTRPTAGTWSVR